MAKGFVPTSYFKKIGTTKLLSEYYASKNILGFEPLAESIPKKEQLEIMTDFYKNIDPSIKIELDKEFTKISKLSTKSSASILARIATENKIKMDLAEYVGANASDKILYYATHHNELLSEAVFLSAFHEIRGYKTYPVPEKEINEIESKIISLKNEFERVVRKETRGRFSFIEHKTFDKRFYLLVSFEDYPMLIPCVNFKDDQLDLENIARPIKNIFIIYHPDTKELDIKYTGGKKERDLFLETVLRMLFDTQLDTKVQKYDVSGFSNKTMNLVTNTAVGDLLSWRMQGLGLIFPDTKQKLRLSAPKGRGASDGIEDMWNVVDSLNLTSKMNSAQIGSVSLSFRFADPTNDSGVITVNCSVNETNCSLGNLTSFERQAKKILKESNIDLGFVEEVVG